MSNIQITGRHLEITPAISDYVKKKLEKVEKRFDHITHVHVILKVENNQQIAEATLHASGHTDIFAESRDANLYAAIDFLIDKLDRQILKHKDKMKAH